MSGAKEWKLLEAENEEEVISHREPGEEFLFYRAVAEGMIDAVQENCSLGAFENMEGVGKLSEPPLPLRGDGGHADPLLHGGRHGHGGGVSAQ